MTYLYATTHDAFHVALFVFAMVGVFVVFGWAEDRL